MGADYAATHAGLGRLAKIFDYRGRLPSTCINGKSTRRSSVVTRRTRRTTSPGRGHGRAPGDLPRRPSLDRRGQGYEVLLPYLVDWDSDLILRHSVAYLQVAEEGFHVPSGVLHAPGSALTIELQEDSDVFAMLQALNDGMRSRRSCSGRMFARGS